MLVASESLGHGKWRAPARVQTTGVLLEVKWVCWIHHKDRSFLQNLLRKVFKMDEKRELLVQEKAAKALARSLSRRGKGARFLDPGI